MMAPSKDIVSLNCPNCGAPLEFAPGQRLIQCAFCGSSIERSDEALSSEDVRQALDAYKARGPSAEAKRFAVTMQEGQPRVIEAAAPEGRRAARVTCLLLLFIACVTLVPIGFASLNTALVARALRAVFSGDMDVALTAVPAFTQRIRVGDSAVLIPSLGDAPPDILALTMQYPMDGGDQTRRLVALSSAAPELLWQSAPLDPDIYHVPLVANDNFVYFVEGERLVALNRADGSAAWGAPLPDELSFALCDGCLRQLGGRVFTLGADGTLLASDGETGAPVWEFRMTQDAPRGLYVLGGRLALMDRDEEVNGVLRLFDPATGAMDVLQPSCSSKTFSSEMYADWTTPLYPAPDGDSFYIVYGSPDLCVQRWDARRMEQLWSTAAHDDLDYDSAALVTERGLYLGDDALLYAFDAATGAAQALIEEEDYTFVPLEVVGEDVLVRATRQRGSERYELRRVDGAGGGAVWTFDLGRHPPLDPPDAAHSIIDEDAPVWTWHRMPDELLILRFRRAESETGHALVVEALDPATGDSAGTYEVNLGVRTTILSAPAFRTWWRDTLWMSVEGQLLGFDARAGEIVYRWP
jgi:LSD1 subclass zinc finger protein